MFETTLLIIKPDYLSKRRSLLIKLLNAGFFIQTRRRVVFSPELAAEFYNDMSDTRNFMFEVFLLSKGTSEAVILTKENAVEHLLNFLVCFFGTTMEMDLNVHVSRHASCARREISFIFANHIAEPTPEFQRHKFMQIPFLEPMICELYEMLKPDAEQQIVENWRVRLSEYLTLSNQTLPHITNQCSQLASAVHEEKSQQTELLGLKMVKGVKGPFVTDQVDSEASTTSGLSSDLLQSSTSCMTCTSFISKEVCPEVMEPKDADLPEKHFVAKVAEGPGSTSSEEGHGAGIKWNRLSGEQSEDEGAMVDEFARHGGEPAAIVITSMHEDEYLEGEDEASGEVLDYTEDEMGEEETKEEKQVVPAEAQALPKIVEEILPQPETMPAAEN